MRVRLNFSPWALAVGVLRGHVDSKYVRVHHLTFYLPFVFLSFMWHEIR